MRLVFLATDPKGPLVKKVLEKYPQTIIMKRLALFLGKPFLGAFPQCEMASLAARLGIASHCKQERYDAHGNRKRRVYSGLDDV